MKMPVKVNGYPNKMNGETNNKVDDDRIVISGFSGRFPECDNVDELKEALFAGVDLVTADDRRWPCGIYGLPTRSGKMKNINLFDAPFFGIHPKQADVMDPQLRFLLETTFEALIDAGVNPTELRNSRTGVFIGACESESADFWRRDPDTINGYGLLGCTRSMFANRISYTFDLKGPSFTMDTACSSSMVALQNAVTAMEAGTCDAAIVGGTNLILQPTSSLQFHRLGMLSADGKCKAFDESGNGYVRSEAVVIMFLQKSSKAKRSYATILGIKTNTDGYKSEGITYPSGAVQKQLIKATCQEANIDPLQVSYVEAHGTGTAVGDPQEINSVVDVFTLGRTTDNPLLLGSVKSNLGHSEGASGLVSIVKVLLAMENAQIPQNLHFNQPNPDIAGLTSGLVKVCDQNTHWNGQIAAVNSFGFGGSNVHIILKANPRIKVKNELLVPQLVVASGRTHDGILKLLKETQRHSKDTELITLINSVYRTKIHGHIYRGFSLLNFNCENNVEIEQDNEINRPVWYVFTGMGAQWPGMAKDLMNVPLFAHSICKSAQFLQKYGVDLKTIVVDGTEDTFNNILASFISITAIQIALVDVLKALNVFPDGMLGHSVGEIGCAYADDSLTAEQAILAAYSRGRAIIESDIPIGCMAAVGLSWEEARKRCPPGVYPACHNGPDSVTISGPPDVVNQFIIELQRENIFAKAVQSSGVAFHSKYIAAAGPKLRNALEQVIITPKARSVKWISTSVPESDWNTNLAQYSSVDYHVNNLLSPVLFNNALKHIPDNAVVIEIAPTGLLQAILKRALTNMKNITNIPLMKKNHPNCTEFLMHALGTIYVAGVDLDLSKLSTTNGLYPVSKGTPMISSWMKWDHSQEWSVADFKNPSTGGYDFNVTIDLSRESDQFIMGHRIDDRILYPATGYLFQVWRTFARLKNMEYEQLPVCFENVSFHRATIVPEDKPIKLRIHFLETTGQFTISDNNSLVVSGTIQESTWRRSFINATNKDSECIMYSDDIYKELRLRGYSYTGAFQGVTSFKPKYLTGTVKWNDNWITFMDQMLQVAILIQNTRSLYVPTNIRKLEINPVQHLECINADGVVTVEFNEKMETIIGGGVEIRGHKCASTAKKQHVHPTPKIEKYSFVPYEQMKSLDAQMCLTIFGQIVAENFPNTRTINVVEITDENSLMLNELKLILESEPMLSLDGSIIYTTALIHPNNTDNETAFKTITNQSLDTLVFDSNIHLVIISGFNREQKIAIANKVPQNVFVITTGHYKSNADLHVISATNDYQLLRKTGIDVNILSSKCIEITNHNFKWLTALKSALNDKTTERIYLYTNEQDNGLIGMVNCLIREPYGDKIRAFFLDNGQFSLSNHREQIQLDLLHNVLRKNVWGSYRFIKLDGSASTTQLPVENAYVTTLTRGDLSSLKWFEGPQLRSNEDMELCHVYYAPLNFRDVMLATGKLTPDSLPGNLGQQENVLGLEFSGTTSQGIRVMGMVEAQGLATNVLVDKDFLLKVPDSWSLEEASTIPVVYATSYYALVMRGGLKSSESLLIHAGSGGVGLAAISIALHMGCRVFTTVSTNVKRDFLLNRYPQLNSQDIGSSRDDTFEHMIMERTNGKGVDLVLNSLAGPLLQASVRCLAIGGRFLEIGKMDLAQNTALGMGVFLKNTTFHGILLDQLFYESGTLKRSLMQLLQNGIEMGAVRPLPTSRFDQNQIEEAFRFIATGKHMGKVVIQIRNENCKVVKVPAIPKTYFDPDKTYILIGGLGGFGLELTDWLIKRGATKLVLTSRRGVSSGYQTSRIKNWQQRGTTITVSNADLTIQDNVTKLLSEINNPIGGIFNLAAVLVDGLFEGLTEDQYWTVCQPKMIVTKNLDIVSRRLAPHLDYFVCFSSVSCGRGNLGQSNYGYANSTMERMCEKRQNDGLPAIAIQWGAIGDVGLVYQMMGGNQVEVGGTLPQRIHSCLETLDFLLQQLDPVLSSVVIAEKRHKSNENGSSMSLTDAIANVLGIKDVNKLRTGITLADLGMDSIMSSEIKQMLERNHDVVLTVQEIRNLTFEHIAKICNSTESTNGVTVEKSTEILIKEIMPKQCLIQMQSSNSERHNENITFLVHPIEGTVDDLTFLAQRLHGTVYGLQCTKSADLDCIEKLAASYIQQIQTVQFKGTYTLVGYSFGAALAFEMGLQLEEQNHTVDLILIDGSPDFVSNYTTKIRDTKNLQKNLDGQQSEALAFFISKFITDINQGKIFDELMTLSTWEERLIATASRLQSVVQCSNDDIKDAAESFYRKLIIGNKYIPNEIFLGKVTLLKATSSIFTITNDYGLTKICKKPVDIHLIEGDHRTIVVNEQGVEMIANICNNRI